MAVDNAIYPISYQVCEKERTKLTHAVVFVFRGRFMDIERVSTSTIVLRIEPTSTLPA